MCRWLAYSGAPIYLEEAIFDADHSLISQSRNARLSESATNADGFGVGWYGSRKEPGVFKDIQPAWNDANLRALAHQIASPMFLAHVRATTGTAVQRTNCHPFQRGRWLFVHNGVVDGFSAMKRDLVMEVAPALFGDLRGTTDSELLFYLALTFGMEDDVLGGLQRMAGFVEHVGRRHGVEHPLQMSLGIADGRSLHAVRYSTERRSRTLFCSESIDALREIAPETGRFSSDARAIVSEPLSDLAEAWIPIEESTFVTITDGELDQRAFTPAAP